MFSFLLSLSSENTLENINGKNTITDGMADCKTAIQGLIGSLTVE